MLIRLIIIKIVFIVLAFSFFTLNIYGKEEKKVKRTTQKPTILDRKLLDVNQISGYFRNDGEFYSDHSTTGPGFEWPKGSGTHAIFSAGLWIGGKVVSDANPAVKEIRVATVGHFGSEYRPGKILSDGNPDDYTKPEYRYYKVRPKLDNYLMKDYAEWPVTQGAPYHDINGNGIYEPTIDKPALILPDKVIYPDMMLFAVYNDANPAYHTWIWGRSKPLGVEVRQLNWAFEFGLSDVQFIKFQIYNKSNKVIDSMYMTFWSDPDLGDVFDDYVGCDTTFDSRGKRHNLGYCYNGDNSDGPPGYGSPPPAVGIKLLQGPLIYTGSDNDTANGFGKKWVGYKNIDLSGFNFYCNPGMGGCINPEWYDPSLYEQSYNIMRSLTRSGKPQICQGDTVKFMFAGDPVTGTGCINSSLFPLISPTDFRFTMPTGPITLAPGDSQEVVYVSLIAKGTNNLNSITQLRNLSYIVQKMYDNNFKDIPIVHILPPNIYNPPFVINVRIDNAKSIFATIRDHYDLLLGNVELFDDGYHSDSLPNDGVWGNILHSAVSPAGSYLNLEVEYIDGKKISWNRIIFGIPTIGRPKLLDFDIVSDNINSDKIINPGEDIRYRLKLKNTTSAPLQDFSISSYKTTSPFIGFSDFPVNVLDTIDVGELSDWIPSTNNKKYFSFNVSNSTPDGHIGEIIYKIYSNNGNIWLDTLKFQVEDFIYNPVDTFSTQIYGLSDSRFRIRLVDYSKLKDNEYKITITKISNDDLRFNLINSTLGDTLLKLCPILTEENYDEHVFPVVDGFKVLTDQVVTRIGLREWKYPIETNFWFTGVNGWITADVKCKRYGFAAYPTSNTFNQSGFKGDELKKVIIKFSDYETQKAYRYISGFATFPPSMTKVKHPEFRPFVKDSMGMGFLYQDYEKYPLGNPIYGNTAPFTVWETDKSGNIIRQLDVGIVERNDLLYQWNYISPGESVKTYVYLGNIDGKWNPSPFTDYPIRQGDELLMIFGTSYTDTPKTIYTGGTTDNYRPHYNLLNDFHNLPVMYIVWMRRITLDTTFNEGEVLELIPYFPVTGNDVYIFNPVRLLKDYQERLIPKHYVLYQNYPNPFNSTTTIRYDVAERADVEISVYDILGRKIQTLVNEQKTPGTYQVIWDGRNKNGVSVSSGVYLVRYKAGPFTQSRKILFLK